MREPSRSEQTPIERLADVMQVHYGRDKCADQLVEGAQGNIHEDGAGYSVAVLLGTARQWSATKAKLKAFCTLRQDGDTEGILHMANLPTPEQAETLREALGVRKIREVSPEEAVRLREMGFKRAINDDFGALERQSRLRRGPEPFVGQEGLLRARKR